MGVNLKVALLMLKMQQRKVEKQQWPSLKERSGSLSLNLEQHNLALVKLQSPSNVQSARVRNLLLLKERIGKTKIVCLSWLESCRSRHTNSKLKRLRRLLLSTWPSSERLNKSLRKLKKEQSLPWFCKQFTTSQSLNPSRFKKISRS